MLTFSHLYDRKALLSFLAQLVLVVGVLYVTNGSAYVAVAPLVFFGLVMKRTEMLFFWLLAAVCLLISNGHVVHKGLVFAWTQRMVMVVLGGCMAIQVIGVAKHRAVRPFLGMLAYILVMCVSSSVGWCPIISFMKLFLFTLIYCSFLGVANKVGMDAHVSTRRIRSIILVFSIYFVFGSVALLPFPGLSQLDAKTILEMGGSLEDLKGRVSLFMGMTTHSQSLGPIISMISVVLLSDLFFSIKKFDALYMSLLLCCPFLMFKTSSRTGMGSFLLGVIFVVLLFYHAKGVRQRWKNRVLMIVWIAFFLFLIVVVGSSQFRRGIRQYAVKFDDADSAVVTSENVLKTRWGKVEETWNNFVKSPFVGNGFQVSEDMKGMKIDGFVLSAPIEKGVWVTAVLEEGGIVGFVIFVVFLFACIVGSIKRRAYMTASCVFVMILANLGEFSVFSMSYTGGFEWAMIFAALALDIRKTREDDEERRQQMIQYQLSMNAISGWR